jgi:hypothetical protein
MRPVKPEWELNYHKEGRTKKNYKNGNIKMVFKIIN